LRSLRRADHSSRGVLPTVVRRCVWSRNIKNGCSIYIYDISRLRVKLLLSPCGHITIREQTSPLTNGKIEQLYRITNTRTKQLNMTLKQHILSNDSQRNRKIDFLKYVRNSYLLGLRTGTQCSRVFLDSVSVYLNQ